ncbi:MAG: hypothetical protein L3J82_07080 [Planctomycetes bacterium]|nr:hypothetical protein [Planctomycetota bacterium]
MSELSTTIATYNARALAMGVALESTSGEFKLLETLVRRTGRPLPQVLVVGRRLAAQVNAFETIGAHATGIDAAESAVNAATEAFPSLIFRCLNTRELTQPEYDCVWTENLFSRMPASEFESAMNGLLSSIYSGGLLRMAVWVGAGEKLTDTSHGQIIRRGFELNWLEEAMDKLNCSLLENVELEIGRHGLTFRKEY